MHLSNLHIMAYMMGYISNFFFYKTEAASLPAAGVTYVTGLKFVFEYHLSLRPFITAENGCFTMYYNAIDVD